MDILDIDEVLKDDSFIFFEEKNHDDVSNILQQWKINNCIKQQPELAQEQVYKLNSRTFTRPKRKTAQNLESQFSNFQSHPQNALQEQQQQQQQQQHVAHMSKGGMPMVNLEIGGLVTHMHNSFLQDTSPPPSICSSMDVSVDCLNNASLITSADFANINFLQSTHSLELRGPELNGFGLAGKATHEGYTLSDAIRDRKALDALTNSGDGTLIKDSHIAQIDDISLALSKTGSACSTMDNSTESVESNNRTVELIFKPTQRPIVNNNTVLQEDLISDTTFNLVETSMAVVCEEEEEAAAPVPVESHLNETFKKPTPMDETMIAIGSGGNSTFDCQLPLTPDNRCETPEAVDKRSHAAALKMYESTPHASHVRSACHNKQQYTPTIKMAGDDVNLSPIVALGGNAAALNATRTFNDTYERPAASATASAAYGKQAEKEASKFHDETFNKELQQLEKAAEDLSEMRSVMDMAQAEAALLNDGYDDEAQFERMLNQFDQVEMKEEQLKMKKSLETIKKRFHCGLDRSPQEAPPAPAADETFEKLPLNRTTGSASGSGSLSSTTSPLAPAGPSTLTQSGHSSGSATSGGERLLNRRSRLYDDFVPKHPPMGSTSFTVRESGGDDYEGAPTKTETAEEQEERPEPQKRCIPQTKLFRATDGAAPERERERERDRDRFKTILIDRKQREAARETAVAQAQPAGVAENGIIVPCIDGELADGEPEGPLEAVNVSAGATMQRHSRRDTSEEPEPGHPANPNFLTYKKLKDKSSLVAAPASDVPEKPKSRLEPRSLSRPRYISGLPKFSVVSKATSASDLENSLNCTKDKNRGSAPNESIGKLARPQSGVLPSKNGGGAYGGARVATQSELKSPMGIKSKSFHNLSNNFGYPNGGGAGMPKNTGLAVAKRNVGEENQNANEVFKAPTSKLVSGIRAPGSVGGAGPGKRLTRPSSGYYSLNPKGYAQHMTDGGGESDSETPSNTSRVSGGGLNTTATTKALAALTKVTTTGTGIPKPSGLRAPSNVKRSGLPKPTTGVARR